MPFSSVLFHLSRNLRRRLGTSCLLVDCSTLDYPYVQGLLLKLYKRLWMVEGSTALSNQSNMKLAANCTNEYVYYYCSYELQFIVYHSCNVRSMSNGKLGCYHEKNVSHASIPSFYFSPQVDSFPRVCNYG